MFTLFMNVVSMVTNKIAEEIAGASKLATKEAGKKR